ncbi:MAG TPA: serine hydrolase domain-containing protein [Vicinamibacterales bacterium]|nr:serine hydrolase domain-containing protein [Vicinamibacterales bacterium]
MSSSPSAISLIERAIAARAFPAAVVETGGRAGVRWRQAFGALTYAPDSPATTTETIFDLASLTKVIATATQAMRAVDAGALALDRRVAEHVPAWRGIDREAVTIADLLEHASGLTAYLPFFRDHHGRAEFERGICTLPLEYAPRTQSIYSDLGFILLGFILEDVGFPLDEFNAGEFRLKAEATSAICSFRLEAEFPDRLQAEFRDRLQAEFPDRLQAEWRARCAPTELDLWRGRLLQGEVHDENCWALGGVAGHTGLFGTAAGVGAFAREILRGLAGERSGLRVTSDTLARFVKKSTVPGSSRALAWDTMLPTSSCGTRLSPRAIGHTGFTGTSLWIDPELDLYVVFLTNRVHPTRDNNAIQPVRRALHDALASRAPTAN